MDDGGEGDGGRGAHQKRGEPDVIKREGGSHQKKVELMI